MRRDIAAMPPKLRCNWLVAFNSETRTCKDAVKRLGSAQLATGLRRCSAAGREHLPVPLDANRPDLGSSPSTRFVVSGRRARDRLSIRRCAQGPRPQHPCGIHHSLRRVGRHAVVRVGTLCGLLISRPRQRLPKSARPTERPRRVAGISPTAGYPAALSVPTNATRRASALSRFGRHESGPREGSLRRPGWSN